MARVQFGALITEITGSIGGFTFQRNRSGSIIRLRPVGSKKQSVKQSLQQAKHLTFLSLWQNLTFFQKSEWNEFASLHPKINSFGQEKTLSGLNWFESINQNLQAISQPIVSIPPVYQLPVAPGNFIYIMSLSELKIIFQPDFDPANESLFIRATHPMSLTSSALQKNLRLIKVVNIPPYGTVDLKSAWQAYFNIPYPPSSSLDCFNIGIQVQTVHKVSGITSVGVIDISRIGEINTGIGFMQIGTSFIVSAPPVPTPDGIGIYKIGFNFKIS